MKLTRISVLRRQELRIAAYEVLQREGIAGATLEKVAAHTNSSKGIVLHYFRNKQELFEQAMREANMQLGKAVAARLKQAKTPHERIAAVVEGNFEECFYQPPICHAWLSLCAEVPREPQLARIQKVIHARMRSNLLSGLRDLLPADDCEEVALALTTLIDGLWLRLGLDSGGITREGALDQVYAYLAHRLPGGWPGRSISV